MSRSVLLRNGSVYSPADPFATAMLVVGDRIAWVGQEGAADGHVDVVDEVVNLDGALVTPAFVDAHVHVLGTAMGERGLDAAGANSLADLLARIADQARSRPGEPIGGQGWDEHNWPERRVPTQDEIDLASGGEVVIVSRVDGHSSLVSSALLAAEPAIATADGFEGPLVRRAAQTLARQAAERRITPSLRRELHLRVLRRAAALGIGAVHEMAAPHINSMEDAAALVALSNDDEHAVPEVTLYWGETGAGVEVARELGARGAAGDLTVDGSVGSRSAAVAAPYTDDPSSSGHRYLDVDAAADHVLRCTAAGLQAGFHCIGDDAVRIAVAAFTRAAQTVGVDAVIAGRHRLEHVEMISPDVIAEMARLGITASVQPAFDALWGGSDGMYAARLGPDRAEAMNPFAAMSRAGVTLAFGSDSPVTALGGWDAVRAAAFHHTPEHRISTRAAFTAATRGGWRAAGVDDAGVLAPGMLASYVIWDVPGELVVQAPDERVAAWSTDPRSGVPGLPDLAPGAPLPECRRTVARGATVYDRG